MNVGTTAIIGVIMEIKREDETYKGV